MELIFYWGLRTQRHIREERKKEKKGRKEGRKEGRGKEEEKKPSGNGKSWLEDASAGLECGEW